MPYTTKSDRARTRADGPETVGDLNFLLTERCVAYLEHNGLRYTTINMLIGQLESALRIFRSGRIERHDSKDALHFATILQNFDMLHSAHDNVAELMDAITGVVRCCQMELYRRVAVPYEEKKIVENGDVYPLKYTGMEMADA